MTKRAPDPVTDVWELLWTAAWDYREAKPQRSEAGLIDALMPIVRDYGDARAADELTLTAEAIDQGPTFPMPPSIVSALVRERADDLNPRAEEAS